MRITNRISHRILLNDIQNSYDLMAKYQHQVSSGKRINVPSDDPVGVSRLFWLNSATSQITQYMSNIDIALDEMKGSSEYLDSVQDSLLRVKEIQIQAANGMNTQEQLNTLAYQVDAILKNLVTTSNQTINNKYLYAGFKTGTVPFTPTYAGGFINGMTYNGDVGQRNIEINSGLTVTVNFAGDNTAAPGSPGVFVDTASGVNVFTALINMRDDLFAGNLNNVTGVDAPAVSSYVTHLQSLIGMQAVQIDEMENLKDNHTDDKLFKTNLRVSIEEIDAAEAISNLSNQEVAYKAALQVGSQVSQITMFDFLK